MRFLAAGWQRPGSMQAACWQQAGSILAAFWQHPGSILAASWQHAGSVLAASWQRPGNIRTICWQHAGSVLAASWQHAGNFLAASWQRPGSMAACWQRAGSVLAACWQHAGSMLAAFLSEHALICHINMRMVVLEPPHNPPLKQTANIIRLFPPSSLKALRLHVCNILQTSYGRTRAHALGMRAHMPSYAATASMKHAQHVQTISSRWCKRIIQKHGLGMVPFCGPKNGRASAGRPEDIHCECLGPVPRPCVQKLGFRSGPRCKLCFGVANANVKCMPWCQNAREKKSMSPPTRTSKQYFPLASQGPPCDSVGQRALAP